MLVDGWGPVKRLNVEYLQKRVDKNLPQIPWDRLDTYVMLLHTRPAYDLFNVRSICNLEPFYYFNSSLFLTQYWASIEKSFHSVQSKYNMEAARQVEANWCTTHPGHIWTGYCSLILFEISITFAAVLRALVKLGRKAKKTRHKDFRPHRRWPHPFLPQFKGFPLSTSRFKGFSATIGGKKMF